MENDTKLRGVINDLLLSDEALIAVTTFENVILTFFLSL